MRETFHQLIVFVQSAHIKWFAKDKENMKIKTYKEDDIFPSNTWFADYQPRPEFGKIVSGDILIRQRDDASTVCLIDIPVGGRRGVPPKKAAVITSIILDVLNQKGT